MSRRRVDVAMSGRDILAAVASIAVDPRCPECGGSVQLDTDDRGRVTVAIDHEPGCEHARDGQKSRSEA
ncbi:MAG: hypothetical protein ACJ736_16560 [Streptomyces sp.]